MDSKSERYFAINGAFGVGKTASACHLRERDPRWRLFDPEWVGYMLRANLTEVAFDDFQDLPAWRALVPVVAREIINHTHDDLVAVQTVLHERYWRELASGFAECEIPVFHVVLDADDETLRARIAATETIPSPRPGGSTTYPHTPKLDRGSSLTPMSSSMQHAPTQKRLQKRSLLP